MVKNNNVMNPLEEGSSIANEVVFSSIAEDVLIKLLESYPKLAITLIEKGIVQDDQEAQKK